MRSPIGARLAALLGLGRVGSAGGTPAPLSALDFRERYIQTLRRMEPDVKVEVISPLELSTSIGGAKPLHSNLHNAFRQYLAAPLALDAVLQHYAGVGIEALRSVEPPQLENLVIVVRTPADLEEIGRTPDHATRPLAADMIEVLAVDRPTSILLPSVDKLTTALGPLDAALWARAWSNTVSVTWPIVALPSYDGLTSVKCNSGYGGAILRIPEVWEWPSLEGAGAVVVAVAKDELLVAHLDDFRQMAAIRDRVTEHRRCRTLVSANLLVRDGEGWATYDPNA